MREMRNRLNLAAMLAFAMAPSEGMPAIRRSRRDMYGRLRPSPGCGATRATRSNKLSVHLVQEAIAKRHRKNNKRWDDANSINWGLNQFLRGTWARVDNRK